MISKELSEMMGKESEHTAVFGSIMRWEWLKRLPVDKAKKFLDETVCPLCVRFGKIDYSSKPFEHYCGQRNCLFYKICNCPGPNSLFKKAEQALKDGNEKDWTKYSAQLCNALWACWNKLFEEPKKEERTYKRGDRFTGEYGEYILATVGGNSVMMINTGDGCYCGSSKTSIKNPFQITEDEFRQICSSSTFTLIESKTGKE